MRVINIYLVIAFIAKHAKVKFTTTIWERL